MREREVERHVEEEREPRAGEEDTEQCGERGLGEAGEKPARRARESGGEIESAKRSSEHLRFRAPVTPVRLAPLAAEGLDDFEVEADLGEEGLELVALGGSDVV